MSRVSLIAAVVILGILVGGAMFVAGWNIPPPSATIETALPDERFPR